jgi:hypothetical protein
MSSGIGSWGPMEQEAPLHLGHFTHILRKDHGYLCDSINPHKAAADA